jgi:hypothetical protein
MATPRSSISEQRAAGSGVRLDGFEHSGEVKEGRE